MTSRFFDAVIFDFDGVLIDSEPLYLAATNAVFGREGIVLSAEVALTYGGLRYDAMLAELIPLLGLSRDVDYYLRESRVEEARIFAEPLVAVTGAPALMSQLTALGVLCGVGSSSDHEWVASILERLELHGHVSAIVGGDQVDRAKPSPDIFLRCSELLGVQPSRCVVIEDSLNGVVAAHAAGMKAIGFPTFSRASLHLAECYAVIQTLEEAAAVLELVSPPPSHGHR